MKIWLCELLCKVLLRVNENIAISYYVCACVCS